MSGAVLPLEGTAKNLKGGNLQYSNRASFDFYNVVSVAGTAICRALNLPTADDGV
jgi:hypothetical protein